MPKSTPTITVTNKPAEVMQLKNSNLLWSGDVEKLLAVMADKMQFDLIVTSPPYNLGKEYEARLELPIYLEGQKRIITRLVDALGPDGSLCWQVGNYVRNNAIVPLDIEIHPIMRDLGLVLRNRIVWTFGHGLHSRKRFSGRYEVVLWYTKSKDYKFNLDAVRINSKYPAKRHYKGPNRGELSSNPRGKNPEDVWTNIPNVKNNHVEKTEHPCQFPVGLIERLVLALTDPGDRVFDPFAGAGSAGVAAVLHKRKFWGAEISRRYVSIATKRINSALNGTAAYRPHDKELYDYTRSKLSVPPDQDL